MPFHATIKNGELFFGSPRAFSAWRTWTRDHDGARVQVTELKRGRTLSQNAYYWVFLDAIERETGQPASEVHEWAKRKFLKPQFITVNGEEIKIPGSTRTLSKNDMSEYLDKIAAETGIALPDPTAAWYLPH